MKRRNWRRPAEYGYTEGLDAGQWAWEFLRRSSASWPCRLTAGRTVSAFDTGFFR
ncbi:MAG: transcriptional regulator domain-containing protein [Thiogranum sp.]